MATTLHLERSMPRAAIAVQDRHATWAILLDGQEVGRIASDETFQTQVPPGSHTLRLASDGKHRSPLRTFEAAEGSVVRFRCHSQPVWPLMVMAAVVPGRWIVLKRR